MYTETILKEIIDRCIHAFKPRLRRVIEVEGRHINLIISSLYR